MSNETQYTPGPWRYKVDSRDGDGLTRFDVLDGDSWFVATVRPDGAGGDVEARPNARLIAAAPELLEALEYARRIVADQLGENSGHLQPLDAAIVKATNPPT